MGGTFSPWLEIGKIAPHLLCTSLSTPGFNGPIIWVQQNKVILLLPPLQYDHADSQIQIGIPREKRAHDGVCHQMSARCHPGSHLWMVNEFT